MAFLLKWLCFLLMFVAFCAVMYYIGMTMEDDDNNHRPKW